MEQEGLGLYLATSFKVKKTDRSTPLACSPTCRWGHPPIVAGIRRAAAQTIVNDVKEWRCPKSTKEAIMAAITAPPP